MLHGRRDQYSPVRTASCRMSPEARSLPWLYQLMAAPKTKLTISYMLCENASNMIFPLYNTDTPACSTAFYLRVLLVSCQYWSQPSFLSQLRLMMQSRAVKTTRLNCTQQKTNQTLNIILFTINHRYSLPSARPKREPCDYSLTSTLTEPQWHKAEINRNASWEEQNLVHNYITPSSVHKELAHLSVYTLRLYKCSPSTSTF